MNHVQGHTVEADPASVKLCSPSLGQVLGLLELQNQPYLVWLGWSLHHPVDEGWQV